MDVSAISTTTQTSDADDAAIGLAEDFDSFLKLLTTQLQQQDPTQPMDTNEFTAQIVQFTSVEQSVKTNQNLEQLIALTEQQYSGLDQGTAVNYLGKYVTVDGSTRTTVGGAGAWPFAVEGDAVMATVGVYNDAGEMVSIEEVQLSGEPGVYTYDWNGQDMQGNVQPDGDYSVQIIAFDGDGNEVTTTTNIGGTVTAVDFTDGNYIMRLANGERYDLNKVLMVEEPAETTDTSTTNTDTLVDTVTDALTSS